MKRLIVYFILVLTFFACQNPKSTKVETDTTQAKVELTELTFYVSGLHCENCVASVNKGVKQLEGVDFVETTLADSTAKVKFDNSKVNAEEIVKAIKKRGYVATVVN